MDTVDRKTRSRMMSSIKSGDTKPELMVRRFLHAHGFRYRLHAKDLPGSPDIVLPRYGAVVQVHGCYWHRHPGCRYAYSPKSNIEFWEEKFQANVERDALTEAALADLGWRVIVVWGCEATDPCRLEQLVEELIANGR